MTIHLVKSLFCSGGGEKDEDPEGSTVALAATVFGGQSCVGSSFKAAC
jgi:hypothetical protein